MSITETTAAPAAKIHRGAQRALPPAAVGYVEKRLVRGEERLAVFHRDGSISNTFGLDESRDYVAGQLAADGLELRDDNTIVSNVALAEA